MPHIRTSNPVPNIRDYSATPNLRISSFQTGRAGDVIPAGTPIGLLLALTRAVKESASTSYSDFRPTVRTSGNYSSNYS